jgi:hypothetical protein
MLSRKLAWVKTSLLLSSQKSVARLSRRGFQVSEQPVVYTRISFAGGVAGNLPLFMRVSLYPVEDLPLGKEKKGEATYPFRVFWYWYHDNAPAGSVYKSCRGTDFDPRGSGHSANRFLNYDQGIEWLLAGEEL